MPVEQLGHRAHAGGVQSALGLGGVQHHEAAFFGPRDVEVAVAHAAMESEIHLLEGVERTIADPSHAFHGIEVEEEGQVRYHPARGEGIEIANGLEVHAAAEALISEGGIGVTVGDDHRATAQRGANDLRHVLLPRRHEEKGLGERGRWGGLHLEEAANGRAERSGVSTTQTSGLPERSETNASRRPSGAQFGSWSRPAVGLSDCNSP